MKKVVKIAASAITSLGLVGGFAGIVGASPSISTTGPNSTNTIRSNNSWQQRVTNRNSVGVSGYNWQNAHSGAVTANHNTTAGSATSGMASNNGSFAASVSLNNTSQSSSTSGITLGTADGTIDHTGPSSTNHISSNTQVTNTVNNTNSVNLSNTNQQSASSGVVNVTNNTTGGNATSGDASNTSTSTFSVNVSN